MPGILAEHTSKLFTTFAASYTYRDRIAGGTPSDPKMIEGWLRSKMPGMTSDVERKMMLVRTIRELGAEIPGSEDGREVDPLSISMETLQEAANKVANSRQTNGFKRPNRVQRDDQVIHTGYLAIETRHVKAAMKENINIRFAGEKWGVTKKGPKNFAAERVFIDPLLDPNLIEPSIYDELTVVDEVTGLRVPKYPDFLFLFDEHGLPFVEPSEVETFIGHVNGPQGPRSNLTLVQVVRNATVHYAARVMDDSITSDNWLLILLSMQENGVGAMRSQGYGRFDLMRWERIAGDVKHVAGAWEGNGFSRKQLTPQQMADMLAAKAALEASGELVGEDVNGLVKVGALG